LDTSSGGIEPNPVPPALPAVELTKRLSAKKPATPTAAAVNKPKTATVKATAAVVSVSVSPPARRFGEVANSLGIRFPESTPIDPKGIITEQFVTGVGEDYTASIQEIEGAAQACGEPLTAEEESEVALLKGLRESKAANDVKIFAQLKETSVKALSQVGAQTDLETYKTSVLLPDEVVVASVEVVAFKGFVGHRSDLKVGKGLLLATKLGSSDRHRLHFYLNDNDVSFSAAQTYVTLATKNDGEGAAQKANQKLNSSATLQGTFRTSFVEVNNIMRTVVEGG